jgi:hypothetical protein
MCKKEEKRSNDVMIKIDEGIDKRDSEKIII